jgi:hypothetical protein
MLNRKALNGAKGMSDIEGSGLATGRVRPIGQPDWPLTRVGASERGHRTRRAGKAAG